MLTAFLILFPSRAQALGLGVSPHELELEVYPLSRATNPIHVVNTSDEEGLYRVYVEGEAKEWFSIAPEEFVLEPGSSQVVEAVILPPLTASGEHHASICVVSLAGASEFKVGCGVKIPVHIQIIPPPPLAAIGVNVTGLPLLGIVITTSVAMGTGIFLWRRRRRRAHEI